MSHKRLCQIFIISISAFFETTAYTEFHHVMQVQILDQLHANEEIVFQLGSLLNKFHHAYDLILELARFKCSAKIVKRIFSQSTSVVSIYLLN